MFQLTILGSSAALPLYGRHNTSQIVQAGKQLIMIDCGEGTQHQCLRYGVSFHKLDMILISHLHGDHFFGLVALLSTMHMVGRTQKLYIFAPQDLAEVIRLQLKVTDSVFRYEIIFKPLPNEGQETIWEDDTLTISTLPLQHRIKPCNGFLLKEKPKKPQLKPQTLPENSPKEYYIRLKAGEDITDEIGNILYKAEEHTFIPPHVSYAYCSDTAYTPSLVPLIKGIDILYHEATFLHEDLVKATETYHSTALQAGLMAQQAEVGKLIIGHISAKYPSPAPLLAEAQKVFANTIFAEEGETFIFEPVL
jgi:ribonuclease Z